MGEKIIQRLARLERELAEQEIVYRIIEPPWLAAMSARVDAALQPQPDEDAPVPEPAPSAEPEEPA